MNSRCLRILLPFWLVAFSFTGLYSQLKMKLQLMPDGESYGVYVIAESWVNPTANTITASGQVTIVMPLDFQWSNVVNHHGNWISNAAVISPPDNVSVKYVSFGLQNDDPQIIFSPTTETLLFTFKNTGDCPDFLYLIDCGTPTESDPFCYPNSMQTNPGNDLAVFDFGNGTAVLYYFSDLYGQYAWDCHDADGDGIVNAHEDTNGNGVFDPGIDDSDLFDPNDPNGDGGLRLSLQLMPDGNSWGMYAKPVGSLAPTVNTTTNEGRIEVVAPLGFEIDSIVNHAGTWVHDTSLDGPLENLTRSYLGFTLIADDPPIQYHEDGPTLLFTIHRNGACPDSLNIIDEDTDPLVLACVPSQNNFCIFNKLNVTDEGVTPTAEYFYVGNYGTSSWSCHDNDGDGIPNAFEDTNGDGEFTPGGYETDLNDPCDPNFPISAELTYEGETVACADVLVDNAYLMVDVEATVISSYTIQYTDGLETFTINNYQIDDQIPVVSFGGAAYKLLSVSDEKGCSVDLGALGEEINILSEGPVVFTSQPTDITSCAGTALSVTADVENQGGGILSLRWQISCDDGATWTDVLNGSPIGFAGAATKTLSIANLSPAISGCQFRLSANTGQCETKFSDTAKIISEGPVSLIEQPTDVQVCAGEPACFSFSANNDGEGQMAYQWQVQVPGNGTWADVIDAVGITGSTTNTLCLDETTTVNGLIFRALVKTEHCSEVISNTASLATDGPVVIQSIPANLTVNAFENATFNANVVNQGGGAMQFQWQHSDDGINWTDMTDGLFGSNQISGTNTSFLVISPATGMDDYQFRLVVSTAICGEIFTPAATLQVNGTLLTIVEDLDEPLLESCGDEYVILVVKYDNTEGIPALMEWEASTDGINWSAVPNALPYQMNNQPDFSVQNRYIAVLAINGTTAQNGMIFRCRLTSSLGLTVESAATELAIAAPLSISLQPVGAAVCFNEGHTFSAVLSNGVGAEQYWSMSIDDGLTWVDLDDNSLTGFGGVFEDVETPNLHITFVAGLDGYLFRLVAQNGACAVVSHEVELEVEDSPACYPASNFVDYKLKLRPDGESWGVWIKATDGFQPTGYNLATSGRIVIAATAGFAYYDVKSQAGGEWKPGKYKLNAPETPGLSYYTFDLIPGQNVLNLQEGNEIMLFSFRKIGNCPNNIYLAHEFVPDGIEPNLFTGIDLGTVPPTNFALNDVYEVGAANCNGGQNYAVNPNNGQQGNGFAEGQSIQVKMTVFPNPATNWLDIRLPEMENIENASHSILATNGAIIKSFPANTFYQKIEIDELPTGLYFITLELDGKTMGRQKFIKK